MAGPDAPDNRDRFDAADLRGFTATVLLHYGMPPDAAARSAEILVDADLAGIESHGIAHLPWHSGYAPGFESGAVNPRPEIAVLRESPVSAAWDADGAFGLLVGAQAMDAAIAKAEASGIGMVTVRNGRHFGAAGYYARMAADRGLIGMAMTAVTPIAVAAGSLDRAFGTNPIAMAAPIRDQPPFLLDMATTAVAGGKLEIAGRQGRALPAGWAVDAEGAASDDPAALRNAGALLPLGSDLSTSSYKGYGLGLMVDILSGVLSGQGPALGNAGVKDGEMGQWFAAWRINLFRDPDEFMDEMSDWVDALRDSRPTPGVDAVQVAGDPEHRAREERTTLGIPLDQETVDQLRDLAAKLNLEFPAALA
ncbi:MAG: Malate/lactate/ureidoglycolate dehydrogenase, LDH2 family [Chloroflexi bacterium]|nr:MAG: Malate/lactate/ureidoglycolate dehydrogenase, LDH2 family [Chloroflexota bacterium]